MSIDYQIDETSDKITLHMCKGTVNVDDSLKLEYNDITACIINHFIDAYNNLI